MASAGTRLFFTAPPALNRQRLWSYEFGSIRTHVEFGVEHWTIEEPAAAGTSVCFRGYRNAYDPELECFDPERNQLFRFELNPFGFTDPADFTEFGDHLYFSADDGIHGTELYRLPISLVSEQDTQPGTPVTGADPIQLYPNPVVSELTIEFAESAGSGVRVELFDAAGRRVRTEVSVLPADDGFIRLDMSDLPAGVYFIRVKGNDFEETMPIVKRR
jgi:hypothetical protein